MMRTSEFFPLEEFERPSIIAGTKEGLAFVRTQPRMLAVLALTLVLSTFAFNFNVTLPVLAKITLHGNGLGVRLPLGRVRRGRARRRARRRVAREGFDPGAADRRRRVRGRGAPPRSGRATCSSPGCCCSSSASASPRGRRTRRRRCSWPRRTACAAGSSASTSTRSWEPARSRGLFAGWLCAKGGTELAFAVAGGVGLVAVIATALKLGWTPRLTPRRRVDQPQHA